MPVKIPDGLPAADILRSENILVIPESQAFKQDIRPLQIALFNIMPLKTVTETQLLRLLSNSPLQVAITLLHPSSYRSRNTSPEHLARFYKNFAQVRSLKFDCLIITGAPVEALEFNQVAYWEELREVMNWSRTNVYSTLHICWGAQAGLHHHYGIRKYSLPQKMFGVFEHKITAYTSPLLHGFDDRFLAPHSRHTDLRREDITSIKVLKILAESDTAGIYLASTQDYRQIFITGHPEYDRFTLQAEYQRDLENGLPISLPVNYFPDDDPSRMPDVSWRGHANLLFANWLNLVYQKTSFK